MDTQKGNTINKLDEILEQYRNGERELPKYDELQSIASSTDELVEELKRQLDMYEAEEYSRQQDDYL